MNISLRPNQQLNALFSLISKEKTNLSKRSDISSSAVQYAFENIENLDWVYLSKEKFELPLDDSVLSTANFWQLPVDAKQFNSILASMSKTFDSHIIRKNFALKLILIAYYKSIIAKNTTKKILSLNINCFGGNYTRESFKQKFGVKHYLKEWDAINKEFQIGGILTYISMLIPDIFIAHEFDINSSEGQQFISSMNKIGYELLSDYQLKGRYSITCIFVRAYDSCNCSAVPNQHSKYLRADIIELGNIIIYGVHCPIDQSFWQELIDASISIEQDKKKSVLIIGDFNVYKKNTIQRNYFEKLLEKRLDIWLKLGHSNSTPTFNDSRLDYAIISNKSFNLVHNMDIDDIPRNLNLTDHSAIILEIQA